MKLGSMFSFGLGVVLCVGILSAGCSGDDEGVTGGKGGSSAKGGAGGKGGGGGKGGAAGSGTGGSGTGGSGTGGSGTGGVTGSGGSSTTGGATGSGGATVVGGSSGAGGRNAGGASGTGGTGAGGSSSLDGGPVVPVDGSPADSGNDAEDAPLPGDDGPSFEDVRGPDSVDAIPPVLLDSGVLDGERLDVEPIDSTLVLLDAEIDTMLLDVPVDTADGAKEASADRPDAGNCIQGIIDNGYAAGTAHPCSECHDNTVDLSAVCETLVRCLLTSGAQGGPCIDDTASCRTNCANNAGASNVATTCVTDLIAQACQ